MVSTIYAKIDPHCPLSVLMNGPKLKTFDDRA